MKKLLYFVLLMVLALPAHALSLKEKQQLADWNVYMVEDGYATTFAKNCGYELPVALDENLVPKFMEGNASAAAYCDLAVYRMSQMCTDELSKEAIASKIKKLDCSFEEGSQGDFSISDDGTLIFKYDVGASDLDNKAKEFLENSL